MIRKYFFLFLLLIITSCSDDINNPTTNENIQGLGEVVTFSGSFELPPGIDPNEILISSVIEEVMPSGFAAVKGSSDNISGFSVEFSVQLFSNTHDFIGVYSTTGELIGLIFREANDLHINHHPLEYYTSAALVMMHPMWLDLSQEGRETLYSNVMGFTNENTPLLQLIRVMISEYGYLDVYDQMIQEAVNDFIETNYRKLSSNHERPELVTYSDIPVDYDIDGNVGEFSTRSEGFQQMQISSDYVVGLRRKDKSEPLELYNFTGFDVSFDTELFFRRNFFNTDSDYEREYFFEKKALDDGLEHYFNITNGFDFSDTKESVNAFRMNNKKLVLQTLRHATGIDFRAVLSNEDLDGLIDMLKSVLVSEYESAPNKNATYYNKALARAISDRESSILNYINSHANSNLHRPLESSLFSTLIETFLASETSNTLGNNSKLMHDIVSYESIVTKCYDFVNQELLDDCVGGGKASETYLWVKIDGNEFLRENVHTFYYTVDSSLGYHLNFQVYGFTADGKRSAQVYYNYSEIVDVFSEEYLGFNFTEDVKPGEPKHEYNASSESGIYNENVNLNIILDDDKYLIGEFDGVCRDYLTGEYFNFKGGFKAAK